MDSIPINTLNPDTTLPSDKAIRAVVTLSWPYSSSTRQCALLLADPDFRLRNRKGQVRVRFTGASAEAVAKAHVGIGDEVVLRLNGGTWEQDSEASRTPGRSVDGELMFRGRLALSVVRSGGDVEVNVDAPVSPPPPVQRSPERNGEIATPLPRTISGLRGSLDGTVERSPSYTYTSPAFAKRLRLSGETLHDSSYDPFSTTDVDTESTKETNWKSFGSNLKWRYSEKTPSPKKAHFADDSTRIEGVEQEMPATISPREPESPLQDAQSRMKMPPPPLPRLQTQADADIASVKDQVPGDVQQHEGPSTPKLQPVHSPTLPLPSPFPTETRQVQFGLVDAGIQPPNSTRTSQASVDSPEIFVSHQRMNEDVVMIDRDGEIAGKSVQDDTTVTDPANDVAQQDVFDRHNLGVDTGTTNELQNTIVDESSQLSQTDQDSHTVEQSGIGHHTITADLPRTPEKASHTLSQIDFGLDGASSAPSSLHATPQSEKDKVMAQTYRSLFGFTDPSQPTPESVPQPVSESPAPAVWFSDLAQRRLEAASIALQDSAKPTAEEGMEAPAISADDVTSVEIDSQPFEQSRPGTLPGRSSEVEVVDLASSSEGEEEDDGHGGEKRSAVAPLPLDLPPQLRAAVLEIQNSQVDSQGEDLLAQESQGSAYSQGAQFPTSLRPNVGLGDSRSETTLQASQFAEIEGSEQTQDQVTLGEFTASGDVLAVSTSSTLEDTETGVGFPPKEIPFERIEVLAPPVESLPLSSTLPDISELVALPDEDPPQDILMGVVHSHQEPIAENLAPQEAAPTTVIEVSSSSPVQAPMSKAIVDTTQDEGLPAQPVGVTVDSTTSVGVGQPSQSESRTEIQIESPAVSEEESVVPVLDNDQEQTTHLVRHTINTPSYPSLPLSPSNSQSLQDMPSQGAAGTISETLTTALPLTPQLSQIETFAQVEDPMLIESNPPLKPVDAYTHTADDASTQILGSQLKDILPTQSQDALLEQAPLSQSQEQPDPSQIAFGVEEPLSQPEKKTPTRKSLRTRLSNVPDVLSDWFSPKRSGSTLVKGKEGLTDTGDETSTPKSTLANGHVTERLDDHVLGVADAAGFRTQLSYFTPLSRLEALINPPSQQSLGTNTIDVLAVVAEPTKEPVRAKTGPRDYYTIFRVSDHSLLADTKVRIEIYRPWMATLPQASVGDVILLRAFAVKSRNGRSYLLSTDASAWCVWKYGGNLQAQDGSEGRPIWAQKGNSANGDVREEVRGPPVELGDEEREHALRLKEWWGTVQSEDPQSHNAHEMSNGPLRNCHTGDPVITEL